MHLERYAMFFLCVEILEENYVVYLITDNGGIGIENKEEER